MITKQIKCTKQKIFKTAERHWQEANYTQKTLTYSKLTIETLKKGVKYVQS